MKLLKFSTKKTESSFFGNRKKITRPIPGINQLSAKESFLQNINTKKRGIKKTTYVGRRYKMFFKLSAVIIVLGGLGYFGYDWVFNSGKFDITNVQITGTQKFVNLDDVKTLVNTQVINKNYFLVKTPELEKTISTNFLGAKTIKVEKKFPNTVNVLIEERVPLAIVYKDADSYLIDGDGFVLGSVQQDFLDLPRINYDADIKIGTFLEKDVVPISIEILRESDREGLKVSSMSFNPRYTELYANNVEVYIGNDKNKKNAIQTLSALIKKMLQDGKILKRVDLRYDKVIVLYD